LNRETQKRIEERTLGQRLAGGEASASALPDDPELRLARLRAELRNLRTRVTEHHPDAIRLKEEIASLSGQAGSAPAPKREALRGSSLDPSASPRTDEESPRSRPELRALEREESSLKQAAAEYEQLVYNAPKREQELQKLLLPYETTKALYHSLLARLEDAQLAEGLEDQQANDPFRLVDPAVAATRPAAPDRWRIIFEGVIVALGLAVAAVLLAENREPSFHCLQDLRSLVRSPVLVSIPRIVTPGDVARRRLRACLAATLMAFTLAASMGGTYAVARGNEPMVWMLALHDH
jgi:uncharacterized protein involved in exopolysaccharide biosynthesis